MKTLGLYNCIIQYFNRNRNYSITNNKMCIYFNLNLILLLFLITFNLLSNSFLSLCSNLPKSTKLTTLNTLNQFKHCCDDGLIAAHSLDLPILTSQTSITNTETCAEILQFGTSVVEDDAENLSSNHFWCQRVQHFCCLSARRLKACQIGSDHVIKYNSNNCSIGEFNHLIDKRLTPIARECCLCQLIWRKSLINENNLFKDNPESVQSVCPNGNCCNFLNKILMEGNTTSAKSSMIMSDDPNVHRIITEYLTTTEEIAMLMTTSSTPITTEKSCIREVPCGYGYVLNPRTQQCEDVDECKVDPLICGKGMACINVRGGHKCVDYHCPGNAKRNKIGDCVPCPTGYVYNASSGVCDDIDECQQANKCRSWEKCINERGFFLCEAKLNCAHGTRINANGTECIDIDECLERSFHCDDGKICVNTLGSYYCTESNCTVTQIYDYQDRKCTCEKGYHILENECVDIDECSENKHNCTYDSTCMNHIGGFRCIRIEECPSGLKRKSQFSRCEDINECELNRDSCGAHTFCKNTIGSYQCICKHGYKNINETDCTDIDECSIFTPAESCPDTRARCVNTQGSYVCVCPEGFIWLGYPDLKCKDVNECTEKSDICGKEHQCVNMIGGYRCQCAPGYKNGENEKSCVDIDECNVKPYNNDINYISPCPYSLCINQPGSYQCQCPDGFRLGRGNRCYDIDECHEMENVCKSNNPYAPSQACINLMGSYRCVSDETPPNYVKHRLGNGFRYELKDNTKCSNIGEKCIQRMDDLFIELDQDARVPQTLARIDTKGLPTGVVRIDLSKHYAYQAYSGKQIPVSTAFRLQPSRSHAGSVEVRLLRKLPAPMNILISVHVTISKGDIEIAHAVTKLYLFVTQSFSERLRTSRIIQRGII
ncbi:unnamed protein product [Schistosoma mattheei]|uniref:EGF-like domain-containing protein n=1 Tax=Schistosoma mattheei TaxID=31246 RepID=A0AA85B904_9TREM|nr:unnamed protein product [Schistosoma mattheei]